MEVVVFGLTVGFGLVFPFWRVYVVFLSRFLTSSLGVEPQSPCSLSFDKFVCGSVRFLFFFCGPWVAQAVFWGAQEF